MDYSTACTLVFEHNIPLSNKADRIYRTFNPSKEDKEFVIFQVEEYMKLLERTDYEI